MTSPRTTPACRSPSAPAHSTGWSTHLGRSQQPPARPGEHRAGQFSRAGGEHGDAQAWGSWWPQAWSAWGLSGCGSPPTTLALTPPAAGAPWATGHARIGPAPGAAPWKVDPSSPHSMPDTTASMAPAPTSSSRYDAPATRQLARGLHRHPQALSSEPSLFLEPAAPRQGLPHGCVRQVWVLSLGDLLGCCHLYV